VEIYNFAVQGYSSRQEAIILDQVALKYNPDAVVVWYFINDIEDHRDTSQLQVVGKTPWLFPPLMSVSRVAFWSSQLVKMSTTGSMYSRIMGNYQPGNPKWETTRGYLQQMARSAQAKGIPILLFSHPQVNQKIQYSFENLHRLVVTSAQQDGFHAFPLAPAFAGHENATLIVHESDLHPNEIAHRLAANYAADKIAPLLPPCPATNAK
jgi:hypothetical protein